MIKFCLQKLILIPLLTVGLSNFALAESTNQPKMTLNNKEITLHSTWVLDYVRPIANFPKAGIQFQWYANLLKEPKAFAKAIAEFADRYRDSEVEAIAGLDSRGFIFGAALAYELELPFILIRKPGKLPGNVEKIDYQLEYGHNSFEIEKDSLRSGQKVLVIDDIFATGGSAAAACALIERLGAEVVEVACLIELSGLHGRKNVAHPVFSLISIEVDE